MHMHVCSVQLLQSPCQHYNYYVYTPGKPQLIIADNIIVLCNCSAEFVRIDRT
jgi:hypothetical protein